MRPSRVRQLRPNSRVAYAIGAAAVVLAAMLAAACAAGDAAVAARALFTQLSVLAGVAQGAALIAALFALAPAAAAPTRADAALIAQSMPVLASDVLARASLTTPDGAATRGGGTLRRTAEVVALVLPVAALAQLVMAGLAAALAPHGGAATGVLLRAAVACALALVGGAYLDATLAPELLAAYERGEVDGPLVRALVRLHPGGAAALASNAARRARWLAGAYVLAYAIAAPWSAHGLIAAMRPAGALLGPFIAVSDAVCALGVLLAVAAVRALGTDEPDEADAELSHAAVVLALASVALGALTLLPFVAALGAGGGSAAMQRLAALFPVYAPTRAWQALAFCGFVVGSVAPATVLGSRIARASVATIGLFAALVVLGAWLVRFALVVPQVAPRYGLIDLGAGACAALLGVLGAAAVMRSVTLEVLFEPRARLSLFPRISHVVV